MTNRIPFLAFAMAFAVATPLSADWLVNRPHDQRQSKPPRSLSEAKPIKPGDAWPNDDKFRWLRGELEIPAEIKGQSVNGQCVGLRLNCGDGGEVWLEGQVQARFDNDHPALVLLTSNAVAGARIQVDVQVYGKVQGGDRFGEASLVLIDRQRACDPLTVTVHASQPTGPVPHGLVGLSQGGGMADYDDATAAKLKEGGFKWFRMDNIFTSVLKKGTNEPFVYDWKDFDRRIDFIAKMGADAVMAVSYMPQVLDAVPNHERQSAPKDYAAWEELCFRAAQRCLERGRRVAFWEVWNEVNTGWLKPGPEDTGSEAFKKLYSQALGKEATDQEVVRRFEAYCKLYRATAKGVRRADPEAKVGGPALASGPFENKERGHCFHGRGFARGLMLWCQQEKLPLDFVSWHEYFQPPDVFIKEAEEFRSALAGFPELERGVRSLMITEWNQAWWADRPQDHEVGAAWAANCVTRAFIPHRIDRPCFFYAKQGDQSFRGDYSLLLKDNTPKAAFNVCNIFNQLSGHWLKVEGTDGEVSCVAAWDETKARLAVVLVNFADRYGMARPVQLAVRQLPKALSNGAWREWRVDATHGNAWHDAKTAELSVVGSGVIEGTALKWSRRLAPNSVSLIEVTKP
jgi:hypothetical protein